MLVSSLNGKQETGANAWQHNIFAVTTLVTLNKLSKFFEQAIEGPCSLFYHQTPVHKFGHRNKDSRLNPVFQANRNSYFIFLGLVRIA